MPENRFRPFKEMPATYILIGICVAVFVVKTILESSTRFADAHYLYQLLGLWVPGIARYNHWWTLLTSMFMHSGIIHLMCNMISLYYLGLFIERLYGSVKFTVLYFVAGLAGGLLYVVLHLNPLANAYAVGASGAIFGLFGAYGILLILENLRPKMFPAQALKSSLNSFLGLLAMNLLISFSPGIAWEAHIGGLVAGAILGYVYYLMRIRSTLGAHHT